MICVYLGRLKRQKIIMVLIIDLLEFERFQPKCKFHGSTSYKYDYCMA